MPAAQPDLLPWISNDVNVILTFSCGEPREPRTFCTNSSLLVPVLFSFQYWQLSSFNQSWSSRPKNIRSVEICDNLWQAKTPSYSCESKLVSNNLMYIRYASIRHAILPWHQSSKLDFWSMLGSSCDTTGFTHSRFRTFLNIFHYCINQC